MHVSRRYVLRRHHVLALWDLRSAHVWSNSMHIYVALRCFSGIEDLPVVERLLCLLLQSPGRILLSPYLTLLVLLSHLLDELHEFGGYFGIGLEVA